MPTLTRGEPALRLVRTDRALPPDEVLVLRWPDGGLQVCWSPGRLVHTRLETDRAYAVEDFLDRARVALMTASDRVQRRWGFPCPRAHAQWRELERRRALYPPTAEVTVLRP